MHDVVIVGSGISGLYLARKVLRERPGSKVLVIEKSNRVGGRAHDTTFRGVEVHEGAGVGRTGHDKRLAELVGVSGTVSWPKRFKGPEKVMAYVRKLRSVPAGPKELFGSFARRVLKDRYSDFENAVGYSDFQTASVPDTLDDYGFELLDSDTFVVRWNEVTSTLCGDVRRMGGVVSMRNAVTKVGDGWVDTSHGRVRAKVVVVATPPCAAAKLMHAPLLKGIGVNRFVRGYAELDLGGPANVAAFRSAFPTSVLTSVVGPLQKVSPLRYTGSKVVVLCAYADSSRAEVLVPAPSPCCPLYTKSKTANMVREARKAFEEVLPAPFRIVASKVISASPGTHCFKPLPARFRCRDAFLHAAQRPAPRTFLIGEAMSRTQGWTEGALESVDAVIDDVLASIGA